jgi:hypothetical protein
MEPIKIAESNADASGMERTFRLVRILAGVAALIAGLALAGWSIATLWTYQRYVTDLGSFTSRFAWESLAVGFLEACLAAGSLFLAVRCFGSKPLRIARPSSS